MKISSFLAHHGIEENPFGAEEARHDPVFDRIVEHSELTHPDFPKILGRLERPSTSIVFGEKGSGKTAIRLLIGRRVAEHNRAHPDRRVLLIPYDDLNPFLDQLIQRRKPGLGAQGINERTLHKMLQTVRLEDHQDAMLALAMTRLNDALLGVARDGEAALLPEDAPKRLRRLPRRLRGQWAVLSALYDQPRSGSLLERWNKVRGRLRLGGWLPWTSTALAAIGLSVLAVGLLAVPPLIDWLRQPADPAPAWLPWAGGAAALGALVFWLLWLWRHVRLFRLTHRVVRETPSIARSRRQLHEMLASLKGDDLADQPWPGQGGDENNSRYELTRRLLEILEAMDYVGLVVLVDRVDEPTVISGHADRMRAVIWPLFDNKFLQQERVGFKLLLPMELRHLMHKESSEFFQEARFDKQSLVDRLEWPGAMLYDLCSERLRACQSADANPIYLTDLFEPEVSREMLVDALDQMHQPRDAFKFLYDVLQEHCGGVPEDAPQYQIPRLTLEAVRKRQSQRVQELYRGLSPA